MISVSTVNDALKSFYLDVLINQLNTAASPLYQKFKTTEHYITGKEAVKPVCYDLSDGVAAMGENDTLPTATGNKYVMLRAGLRNLYGVLEISDKAMRASEDSRGAVVNLLNAEMDGLLTSAKTNFSRMLYGDGSGKLATVAAAVSASRTVTVDSAKLLKPGMHVDMVSGTTHVDAIIGTISGTTVTMVSPVTVAASSVMTIYGAYNNEIYGLETMFSLPGTLYGVTTSGKDWLKPYIGSSTSAISDVKIQTGIDNAEEKSGGHIDFITCSYGVRRAYQSYLETTKRNVNPVELEGGFKAISYAGIPVVADKYCPAGTMYLLDTKLFDMHQLCDWRWIEGENGGVLNQISNKAAYSATLVKYANLICDLPCGQAKLTGITEA